MWAATPPDSCKWSELPNEPQNITGGYLLELEFLDRFYAEISGFESTEGTTKRHGQNTDICK